LSAQRSRSRAAIQNEDKAHAYAVRVLGRRAVSRRRMLDKLRLRGCPEELAQRVVARLAESGLIDDRALAETVVAGQLARKPAGGAYLKSKLAAKGVERSVADEAVAEALEERDLRADALDLALRRAPATEGLDMHVRRRRLTQYLARRGFQPSVCRDAVEAALRTAEADQDG